MSWGTLFPSDMSSGRSGQNNLSIAAPRSLPSPTKARRRRRLRWWRRRQRRRRCVAELCLREETNRVSAGLGVLFDGWIVGSVGRLFGWLVGLYVVVCCCWDVWVWVSIHEVRWKWVGCYWLVESWYLCCLLLLVLLRSKKLNTLRRILSVIVSVWGERGGWFCWKHFCGREEGGFIGSREERRRKLVLEAEGESCKYLTVVVEALTMMVEDGMMGWWLRWWSMIWLD